MVARAGIKRLEPVVHVDVLDLDALAADSLRYEDVVELLILVVEHVGVALGDRHVRDFVHLAQDAGEGSVDGARLDELVEVARDDDGRVGVEFEDRGHKALIHRIRDRL